MNISQFTNNSGYITGITSGNVTTALGYTPVTNARTLSINGTAYDLTADRSWTISAGTTLNGTGFVKASGTTISYDNSTYLTSAITTTVTFSGDNHITYGPNSTWAAYLRVGGNGRTVTGNAYASVVTTDGNLHLDAGNAKTTYINYYAGTSGIAFGTGASGVAASVDASGNIWKGSTVGAGTQYVYNSGTWAINVSGTANNITAYTINQSLGTGNSPTFAEVYTNGWFRNNTNNTGLYNQNTTQHLSSNANGYWDMSSTTSVSAIRFYTGGHVTSLRGYVYADSSNQIGFLNSGGSWSFRMHNSGNAFVTGTLTESSSIRYKDNITDLKYTLADVVKLRGVEYTKKGTSHKEIGVIAEEINAIIPEVVAKNSDGSVESVSYGRLTAVLIEAVKEQQKQIDELKNLLNSK